MKLFENYDFRNKITSFEDFKLSFTSSDVRDEYKPQIREEADRAASEPIPLLPARYYRDFVLNGNRTRYEDLYFIRRNNFMRLIAGEYTFDNGDYVDALIDMIWATCEETSWKLPAHNNHGRETASTPYDRQLPFEYEDDVFFIDLFSAQTGAMIALALFLFRDKLEKACPDTVVRRMEYELNRQILHPLGKYYDVYWWGGLCRPTVNNWNPWIIANLLVVIGMAEKDDAKREQLTEHCCHMIDSYIRLIPSDGSCDEGTSYWAVSTGAVMAFLEMLDEISGGKISVSDNETLRKAGEYILKMHITGSHEFVTFNDCDRYRHYDYPMLYRLGKRMNSPTLSDFAAYYAQHDEILFGSSLPYCGLKYFATTLPTCTFTHETAYYMDKIQIMSARSIYHGNNVFVCAKAGANNEGHGHLDVGIFLLYINGKPVFFDVGVPAYTKDTFNENRFKPWAMRSPYHNTVGVDGIEQANGGKFRATDVIYQNGTLEFEMRETFADSTGIRSVRRRIDATAGLCVTDTFAFDTERTYQFNLLTAAKPELNESGELVVKTTDGDAYAFVFSDGYELSVEELREPPESRLIKAWKTETFYRATLSCRASGGSFSFRLK